MSRLDVKFPSWTDELLIAEQYKKLDLDSLYELLEFQLLLNFASESILASEDAQRLENLKAKHPLFSARDNQDGLSLQERIETFLRFKFIKDNNVKLGKSQKYEFTLNHERIVKVWIKTIDEKGMMTIFRIDGLPFLDGQMSQTLPVLRLEIPEKRGKGRPRKEELE